MKKFWVLVCSLLILVQGILPAGAAAASPVMQIDVERQYCRPGDQVSVSVSLKNNLGVASVKVLLEYDAARLTYETAAFLGEFQELDGVSFTQAVTLEGRSYVILNWVCTTGETTENSFAAITFKSVSNVDVGETLLELHVEQADIFNAEFEQVAYTLHNGSITFIRSPIRVETEESAQGLEFHITNLDLEHEQQVQIIVAFWDAENKRQRAFAVSEIAAAGDLDTLKLIGVNQKKSAVWKLFVLDGTTHHALCEPIVNG